MHLGTLCLLIIDKNVNFGNLGFHSLFLEACHLRWEVSCAPRGRRFQLLEAIREGCHADTVHTLCIYVGEKIIRLDSHLIERRCAPLPPPSFTVNLYITKARATMSDKKE